ncbi:MAG: NTPase [Candidatus Thermoplasmatota archaeon]|nr:NTPase [Candidatus Thermoplasmatota archaeon]
MTKKIKIGITGLPGAGKTHALRKVVEMLEAEGVKVGGMITDAIIENGKKVGFMVQDLLTKEEGVLAHIESRSEVRFLDYGVNMDVLDNIGVNAINTSIDGADVIVIDEVGKLEVESHNFVEVVKDALEADKPLLLTLHKKSRNPLLQDIRRRDDVRILEVTPINKNILPYKIIPLIKEEIGARPLHEMYT